MKLRSLPMMLAAFVAAATIASPAVAQDKAADPLKMAPKSTVVVVHIEGKALVDYIDAMIGKAKDVKDFQDKATQDAFKTQWPAVKEAAGKVTAIDVFVLPLKGLPVPAAPLIVIHTESGVDDLYGFIQKIAKIDQKLTKGENGRYSVPDLPPPLSVTIIEGKTATDLKQNVIYIMPLPPAVANAMLKSFNAGGNEKLTALAKNVDTAAPIWGVADMAFVRESENEMPVRQAPMSIVGQVYPGGPKASSVTMAFETAEHAQQLAKDMSNPIVKTLVDVKVDGKNATISTTLDEKFINKALVAIAEARQMAKMAVSQSYLSNIGMTIVMYQSDNKEQTPQSLSVLVEKGFMDARMLVSPLNDKPPTKIDKDTKSDYVYFVLPANADAKLVRAYDAVALEKGLDVPILWSDATVALLKPDEAKAAIKKTQDALKK